MGCQCQALYSNFDCSYKACPHPTCNGGGKCLLEGSCVCGYSRFESDCKISFNCPNECSLRGACEPGGVCRCFEGFLGADCSIETTVSSAKAVCGLSLAQFILTAVFVMFWLEDVF